MVKFQDGGSKMNKPWCVDDEVRECFNTNKDLLNYSMHRVGVYFFIQGQLHYSHIVTASDAKARFYRQRMSPEDKERADKEWEERVGTFKD